MTKRNQPMKPIIQLILSALLLPLLAATLPAQDEAAKPQQLIDRAIEAKDAQIQKQ